MEFDFLVSSSAHVVPAQFNGQYPFAPKPIMTRYADWPQTPIKVLVRLINRLTGVLGDDPMEGVTQAYYLPYNPDEGPYGPENRQLLYTSLRNYHPMDTVEYKEAGPDLDGFVLDEEIEKMAALRGSTYEEAALFDTSGRNGSQGYGSTEPDCPSGFTFYEEWITEDRPKSNRGYSTPQLSTPSVF